MKSLCDEVLNNNNSIAFVIQLSKASFRQTPVVSVMTFRGQDRYFPLLPNIHILYYPGKGG
jgi:hypothetical protein